MKLLNSLTLEKIEITRTFGFGRRARFKIVFLWSVGSNPTTGILDKTELLLAMN